MSYLIFTLQIIISALLGSIVGLERERSGKEAGVRTHALVSLGSTLFTMLSIHGFADADESRVAAQILTGIGFIGAGTIIHKKGTVEGLTTAAGLWAAAALGMAVGVGWYWEALIVTTVMVVLLLLNTPKWFGKH